VVERHRQRSCAFLARASGLRKKAEKTPQEAADWLAETVDVRATK